MLQVADQLLTDFGDFEVIEEVPEVCRMYICRRVSSQLCCR